jgi:hypothetical protein
MAVPKIEIDALLKSMENIIKNTFFRLQNEYNQAIADGTPPNVAINRIRDQIVLEQGSIIQGASAMASETSKKMRNIYHTLQQEWSTALTAAKKTPQTFQFFSKVGKNWVLPQEAGYTVTTDDLNRKIINFSDNRDRDSIDALLEQKRQQRRIERLSAEQRSIVAGQSANDKENVNLIWIAVFKNTCKDCRRLHGTMKTRLEWEKGKIRPGSGDTICGHNCQCHLIPARTMGNGLFANEPEKVADLTDAQIRTETLKRTETGIKVQKERIKEMAKKRGAKYSKEYEEQLLGQVQDEKFNPYAQSGARTNLYLRKFPKNPVSKKFKENVIVRKKTE